MAPPSPSSFSLVGRDLARSFADHVVLDGVDVTVGPRTRLGVVGPNGVGKSTLLRILAGLVTPDRGSVTGTPPTLRVGYLPQERERRSGESARAALARRTGTAAASAAFEQASAALAAGEPDADDAYTDALDAYLSSGAADFDARARIVAADLGLDEDVLDRPTAALSGGQAAKLALAAILLSRFDVLLLDEPTNDLDFDGLARLERFVHDLPGGVVVVSHDREFLERTVTSVLEIDEHSRKSAEFSGGWDAYVELREVARRHAREDYETYRAQRSRLEERARTQREWAVQGVRRAKRDGNEPDKNVRRFRTQTSEQLASKARASERAVQRLEVVEKPWEGWELRLEFAEAARSGAVVLRLDRAVVTRGEFRLGPVDLEIRWADRVAIVGPNGAGKTTLLRALLGREPLVAGERRIGPSVVVGELEQARARFEGDGSLLDAFIAVTGLPLSEARSRLAKFGLGADHVTRPAASLSPGERTRAVLAEFAARGVNCLVLDEPSNHLDLPAIEQLEQALEGYGGTLLLVTHDRRLLDAVRVTRTVDVENGQVAERV
ncbi:MAG TPA: ABC-F family ATP-binding cassette domain-containing protein [Acidimicrobiia bacterium]|nr:ABC-F family ATP-binding cassette domain-containing protein [Acidimicrobiia bacterium]